MMEWQPIETVFSYIKEQNTEYTSDVKVLLLCGENQSVAYWDEYYAEGGRGYAGGTAWIEPCSGEQIDNHYGPPTHWMPLPQCARRPQQIEPALGRQRRMKMKWIVMWISHRYEPTWEVFETESAARAFIAKERPNIQALYRGELVEDFSA